MKRFLVIALLLFCLAPLVTASGLPFLNDNYPLALSQAKQRDLPLFVEVWAPW